MSNLQHQCEFTCQGCGKKAPGAHYNLSWHKPHEWFERGDEDGVQTACSRGCIDIIAEKSGKTSCVLPL